MKTGGGAGRTCRAFARESRAVRAFDFTKVVRAVRRTLRKSTCSQFAECDTRDVRTLTDVNGLISIR